MATIVVSQPMLFPWVGLLEQVRLADVFVHYDDVAFPTRSFTNRVQLKVPSGSPWITIPLVQHRLSQTIAEVRTVETDPWRRRHLARFAQAYAGAPFADDALALVRRVYDVASDRLRDIVIASLDSLCDYFDLAEGRRFLLSSSLDVPGGGTQRILDIVKHLDGTRYVTGHGARNYLDHARFDAQGVAVDYMKYDRAPYPQLHGPFTPYVSALDLVANMGRAGRQVIQSTAVPWQEFLGDE